MFSDTTSRNVVLLIFFIYYLYLAYLNTKLIFKRNPSNMKCSPIQMMLGSIFESQEEVDKTFSKCMEYSISEEINKNQELQKKENDEFEKKINRYLVNTNNDIKETNDDANENFNKQINNTINKINESNKINNSIYDLAPEIGKIFNKVSEVSNKLPNIMKTFNEKLDI